VSLQVTAATVVSASPTTLSFSFTAGSSNPAAQSISVTGSTTGLPFTAAVTSGSDWLSVTPTSGQTNATLSVSVNPGALAANQTYNGTIVVSGSGTSTGST